MASNITAAASTTFTTANMKPAVDEQIDALKAQNDADNFGHLYHRNILVPIVSWGDSRLVSGLFYKRASHGYARAAFAANSAIGAVTVTLAAFTSISDWGNHGAADAAAATVSSAITMSADTNYTLELDISGLTNGNLYYLSLSFNTSITSRHPPGLFLIHGASATY